METKTYRWRVAGTDLQIGDRIELQSRLTFKEKGATGKVPIAPGAKATVVSLGWNIGLKLDSYHQPLYFAKVHLRRI